MADEGIEGMLAARHVLRDRQMPGGAVKALEGVPVAEGSVEAVETRAK
jgi:myosin-crossreactive antigen